MTDARVPRRAQVVLLDDRKLDFLVQVRHICGNCQKLCTIKRLQCKCQSNAVCFILSATTALAGTFRHGSITF
jgi:hypothetical protein